MINKKEQNVNRRMSI